MSNKLTALLIVCGLSLGGCKPHLRCYTWDIDENGVTSCIQDGCVKWQIDGGWVPVDMRECK